MGRVTRSGGSRPRRRAQDVAGLRRGAVASAAGEPSSQDGKSVAPGQDDSRVGRFGQGWPEKTPWSRFRADGGKDVGRGPVRGEARKSALGNTPAVSRGGRKARTGRRLPFVVGGGPKSVRELVVYSVRVKRNIVSIIFIIQCHGRILPDWHLGCRSQLLLISSGTLYEVYRLPPLTGHTVWPSPCDCPSERWCL